MTIESLVWLDTLRATKMAKKDKRERRKIKIKSARERLANHIPGGYERTSVKLPEGANPFITKKEGAYEIDIIPYEVGKGNPHAKKGEWYYERTFYTHRIGPNNSSYVCLQSFGEKCPVCQARVKAERNGNEAMAKALKRKERQLFNVFDHDQPKKGVMPWEYSSYLFGDNLDNKIKNSPEDKRRRYESFYDPDKGYTLRIVGKEGTAGEGDKKGKFIMFSDIEFHKRKEPLDPALLDETHCLDKLLIKKSYEELKEILEEGIPDSASDDDDDDDDTDDDDDDDEPKKGKKGKKKRKGDDDGDEDEDEEDEADDEDDEDEDDEDDDDSEDDADGDEGEDEDDEDEDEEFEVGQKVSFVYKGKKRTGKIKKINKKKELAQIQVPGQERLSVVNLDELMEPKGKKPKDDDDDDEDDDEWDSADDDDDEDEPKPKKKKKGKKKKSRDDDDEDDDNDD